MKRTIKVLSVGLVFCFALVLVACNAITPAVPTAMEMAQDFIAKGQHKEAYALLYAIENRTEEEEALFARVSIVQAQTKIEHASGVVEDNTFDESGYRTEQLKTYSDGKWEKTTYTNNSEGNVLSYKLITSSGGGANGNNTYDSNGNLIAIDRESDWEIQKTRITYDKDGNMLTKTVESGNQYSGVIKTNYEYKYDSNGKLTEEIVTLNGTTYKYQYTYDAQGRKASYISYSGLTEKYTYDDKGRLLMEVCYQDGEESGSHIYTYDEFDNMLTDVYKNSKGQEEQTTYIYTYDDYGNIMKMIKTEPDEKQETTTITYQLIYN